MKRRCSVVRATILAIGTIVFGGSPWFAPLAVSAPPTIARAFPLDTGSGGFSREDGISPGGGPTESVALAAGDVNRDGVVDANDYAALSQWLAEQATAGIDEDAGDINGDGKIDSLDLIMLNAQVYGGLLITRQPESVAMCPSGSATIFLMVTGLEPIHYRWYQGETGTVAAPAPGAADSPSYTTPDLMETARYWCRVSNPLGSVDSDSARVRVYPATGIAAQPADAVVDWGQTATLRVEAEGRFLSYRWYQGPSGATTAPVGTNSATFTTPALTASVQYWCRVTGTCGARDSAAATVTVNACESPVVTGQPADAAACAGTTEELTVTAAGTGPLSYQWYQGAAGATTTPVGTNSAAVTTPALAATVQYWCRVTGACGTADSDAATVTVSAATAISSQPVDETVYTGTTATLEVTAAGTGPLSYQWYQGAAGTTTAPVGTNSAAFTTPALTATAQYWCRVAGACGAADSDAATVTVRYTHEGGDTVGPDPIVGELKYVPSGSFVPGTADSEPCRYDDEARFTHTLTKSLAMMETEVTRQMWADLKAAQPTLPADPTDPSFGAGPANPVQNAAWYEAVLFANLLSAQNGYRKCYYTDAAFTTPVDAANYETDAVCCDWSANGYRLPSEGEWERACRAGTATPFWIGEPDYTAANCGTASAAGMYPQLETAAWFWANSSAGTQPVGTKASNPWGLADMHGNVWEWCWDWYDEYPAGNATDYRGPAVGMSRVIRGGSWSSDAQDSRAGFRGNADPGSRYEDTGFRLVRATAP